MNSEITSKTVNVEEQQAKAIGLMCRVFECLAKNTDSYEGLLQDLEAVIHSETGEEPGEDDVAMTVGELRAELAKWPQDRRVEVLDRTRSRNWYYCVTGVADLGVSGEGGNTPFLQLDHGCSD